MTKLFRTGEQAQKGKYFCTNCGTELHLNQGDTIPPCPKCTNTEFEKYGK